MINRTMLNSFHQSSPQINFKGLESNEIFSFETSATYNGYLKSKLLTNLNPFAITSR